MMEPIANSAKQPLSSSLLFLVFYRNFRHRSSPQNTEGNQSPQQNSRVGNAHLNL